MSARIALDAMGGDNAPSAVIGGALDAIQHLDLDVQLVGPAALVTDEIYRQTRAYRLPERLSLL